MSIYWIIVIMVIAFGIILPQYGMRKKYYITLMAIVHAFVCGFKYMYLTGDLRKYAWTYYTFESSGWVSEKVLNGGKNTGWFLLMKLFSTLSHGNFQTFLIFLAIIVEIILAVFIYKYSPCPWMSYLVWNCMGFYVTYGFNAIKQGLAMSIILISVMAILEHKPKKFLVSTLIAGFVHFPALAFLPAYWIAHRKVSTKLILQYFVIIAGLYLLKSQIVHFMSSVYYEEDTFVESTANVGGRFWVIVLILFSGFVIKGFQEKNFQILFNLIVIATIFQMFASYDNVFTRFSDYYLQVLVIYLPMLLYKQENIEYVHRKNVWNQGALLVLSNMSIKIGIVMLTVVLIWWYNRTCLGNVVSTVQDNYLDFRFMWDVIN